MSTSREPHPRSHLGEVMLRTLRSWALEALLVTALFALLLQLFPGSYRILFRSIDVRHWSRVQWLIANTLLILSLVSARCWPALIETWHGRKRSVARDSKGEGQTAALGENEDSYDARLRRDVEWRERAKKRLPWH